ncbi:MAG TPA: glycosyltransferase [Salinimicrobium sp.]|nr:glycosyltransferase [Salinimicrobium sp.]
MFHKSQEEIVKNWKGNQPVVSICCITYNHESYIEEALNGFLMQETDFPFEIVIHDDASTDNTANIIKEYEKKYPDLFRPIYQTENQKSKYKSGMNPRFNYPRAKGKYIALCEGDDYWTDPLKLQKQVDFLERHENCSMVFTGCIVNKSNGEKRLIKYDGLKTLDANEYVGENYFMATASLLFKKSILETPAKEWMMKSFAGDFVLRYRALSKGKIGNIKDITVVYNKGISINSWSNRKLNKKNILKEFSDNMRGLYYLDHFKKLDPNIKKNKIKELRQVVYFKSALSKNRIKGLFYLFYNINSMSIHHWMVYFKRMIL